MDEIKLLCCSPGYWGQKKNILYVIQQIGKYGENRRRSSKRWNTAKLLKIEAENYYTDKSAYLFKLLLTCISLGPSTTGASVSAASDLCLPATFLVMISEN